MSTQPDTIKLCADMALYRACAQRLPHGAMVLRIRLLMVLLLLLLPALGSCTTVRPVGKVVKIGLLAPFEGVDRRSGYTALTAMRLAISEADSRVALIPLALDEGADPETARRAAQKLLLAQDLGAIVGPTTPALLAAVDDVLAAHALPWYVPYASAMTPADPADFAAQRWLLPMIQAVARMEQQRGRQRLLLAGGTSPWPAEAALSAILPIVRSEDVADITAQDAVFWLGDVVEGAHYLCRLRTQQPTVPFWLGPTGDTPLLAELCPISGPVAFVTWLDDGYTDWAQAHVLPSPLAYLTYRATLQAIAQINGEQAPGVPAWRVTYFTIQPDGSSVLENVLLER